MKKYLTPCRAIRKNCVECCGGSIKEVRQCTITNCPLHPYRFGRNPNRQAINQKKIASNEIVS